MASREAITVKQGCEIFAISRVGYYAAQRRKLKPQPLCPIKVQLKSHFEASDRSYGSRRLHADLNNKGIRIGRYRVRRLMKEMNIKPMRGVAIFAKDYSGLLLEKSAKTTRPPMPRAAPIRPALLAVHPTRGTQLSFAMTLRHFVKPAFSLRKKRSLKTHALWLSAIKNLHFAKAPFP